MVLELLSGRQVRNVDARRRSLHPIEEVTPDGLRTRADFCELDSIVFATGFDAVTGAPIEQHVKWIRDCVGYANSQGYAQVEGTAEAEKEWGEHMTEVARCDAVASAGYRGFVLRPDNDVGG
jgi:hypothetical protein